MTHKENTTPRYKGERDLETVKMKGWAKIRQANKNQKFRAD